MKVNVLYEKAKLLAIRIFKLYKLLNNEKEFVMSKQLLKSGTSIGANIAESIYGQSTPDFISKLSIAQKETAETMYWLEILHETGFITNEGFQSIFDDTEEMMRMLTSSIKTAKLRIQQ
ncbi:MAG: four helix bundle protein [Bacteroidaceae bacterium]|nr:four helix bundle protein [Bacteroidaceae bacterium]